MKNNSLLFLRAITKNTFAKLTKSVIIKKMMGVGGLMKSKNLSVYREKNITSVITKRIKENINFQISL